MFLYTQNAQKHCTLIACHQKHCTLNIVLGRGGGELCDMSCVSCEMSCVKELGWSSVRGHESSSTKCHTKAALEWVELCEMSWVRWVEWDELCDLSCERWVVWDELCKLWEERSCVRWVVCVVWDNLGEVEWEEEQRRRRRRRQGIQA